MDHGEGDRRPTGGVSPGRNLAELQQRMRELEEREAQTRTTAQGLAHDLRNLLLVISVHAEAAKAELAPENPLQNDLRSVLAATRRAVALTAPLMTAARRDLSAPAATDINGLVTDACTFLQGLCGPMFRLRPLLGATATAWTDRDQLERILLNLVLNARDAMPAGGRIVIETNDTVVPPGEHARRLRISPGNYVLLRVEDNGSGMSRETRRKLFQPFFTTKKPGKGTGLGLSTVARLIKRLGGAVEVQTELGTGSAFSVYLPSSPQGASLRMNASAVLRSVTSTLR